LEKWRRIFFECGLYNCKLHCKQKYLISRSFAQLYFGVVVLELKSVCFTPRDVQPCTEYRVQDPKARKLVSRRFFNNGAITIFFNICNRIKHFRNAQMLTAFTQRPVSAGGWNSTGPYTGYQKRKPVQNLFISVWEQNSRQKNRIARVVINLSMSRRFFQGLRLTEYDKYVNEHRSRFKRRRLCALLL
jgi:hypothetical protein